MPYSQTVKLSTTVLKNNNKKHIKRNRKKERKRKKREKKETRMTASASILQDPNTGKIQKNDI